MGKIQAHYKIVKIYNINLINEILTKILRIKICKTNILLCLLLVIIVNCRLITIEKIYQYLLITSILLEMITTILIIFINLLVNDIRKHKETPHIV